MASSSAVTTQEQQIKRGQQRRFLTKCFVSVLVVTMIAYIPDIRELPSFSEMRDSVRETLEWSHQDKTSFSEMRDSVRETLEWSHQDKTEVRTNITTREISPRGGPVMQPREASNQLNEPAKREMIVTSTIFLRSNISTAAGVGTILKKKTKIIATILNNKHKLDELNITQTLSPSVFRFNYTKSIETGCCNRGRLCQVTCFTERACRGRDLLYPFSSEQERKWFEKDPNRPELTFVKPT